MPTTGMGLSKSLTCPLGMPDLAVGMTLPDLTVGMIFGIGILYVFTYVFGYDTAPIVF